MLVTLFFLLCFLCVVHFIYDRIILPEIRLYYRSELFILRDKVRNILLDKDSCHEDFQAAKILHEALNNSINRLHQLTLSNRVATIRAISSNKNIKDRLLKHVNLIKSSKNRELSRYLDDACNITRNMYVYNSLLFLIYFYPVYLILLIIKYIFKKSMSVFDAMRDRKKEDVEVISFSSDKQFNKIIAHF